MGAALATRISDAGRTVARYQQVEDWPVARVRVGFGGVTVDAVDRETAVGRIAHFSTSPGLDQVVTANLDFLTIARRDPDFGAAVNGASLVVADGMPLVWLSRFRGARLPERITGIELLDACSRLAWQAGQGVFLLGSSPTTALLAARQLQRRYPGLRVDTYSPPFGPFSVDENRKIVGLVRASAPAYLFVALGAPRQELWIHAHRGVLQVPVAMGVGCGLDVLAGAVSRAPHWMQRSGLEWLFRLIQEPGRLWRRYLLDDLPTLGRLVLGLLNAEVGGRRLGGRTASSTGRSPRRQP